MNCAFVFMHAPSACAGATTVDLRLRGLEDNMPGLVVWLLVAWPVRCTGSRFRSCNSGTAGHGADRSDRSGFGQAPA